MNSSKMNKNKIRMESRNYRLKGNAKKSKIFERDVNLIGSSPRLPKIKDVN